MTEPKCCPLETLLDQISGQWTLYILWILSTQGDLRFGMLRRSVDGISTKVLTERLRSLEAAGLVFRHYEPTIPPQVTYGLSDRGKELFEVLDRLYNLAVRWYGEPPVNDPLMERPEKSPLDSNRKPEQVI
ncbi:MAG: helix-turn-helix transcriptional regulator [Oculatellaceae cyanobacterium Prado106]|jgi:DNA-binding HxlR family transcriptional regulator|nr:helix-turn-helix transcriptional regulator [Oculatellaceae cyanobacterium Prado106]